MKKYRIEATAVTTYELIVEADSKEEAIKKTLNGEHADCWEAIDESSFDYDKASVEELSEE